VNVLVIEDDSTTIEILLEEIGKRGHAVIAVMTDAAALEALANNSFDVIVSDFDLGLNSVLVGTKLLDSDLIPAECLTVLFSGLSRDREISAMKRKPYHVFFKDDFFPLLALFDGASE
jgi:CheY-like chemotaxis protein